MAALVTALALVGALVAISWRDRTGGSFEKQRRVLIKLARAKKLDLDEAEDGIVLARRFSSPELEKRFSEIVKRLKVKRD
jgi:hypothetical protein